MKPARLMKIAALSASALLLTGGGVVASIPALRHIAVALAHDPASLSPVPGDPRVRFEEGAENCAFGVAALLPRAIAVVEAAHGRPFRHDVNVGVFASPESYASSNGLGASKPSGVSFLGRVTLSPTLCGPDRDRMGAVLTHELSHAHLQGWLSPLAFARLPSWFNEGLAVIVSDGGGAEGVSEQAAREAIADGYAIAIANEGSLFNLTAVNFVKEPPHGSFFETRLSVYRLAYREAAMFVAWLRRRDAAAFADFLQRIEEGEPFAATFEEKFGAGPRRSWEAFVSDLGDRAD